MCLNACLLADGRLLLSLLMAAVRVTGDSFGSRLAAGTDNGDNQTKHNKEGHHYHPIDDTRGVCVYARLRVCCFLLGRRGWYEVSPLVVTERKGKAKGRRGEGEAPVGGWGCVEDNRALTHLQVCDTLLSVLSLTVFPLLLFSFLFVCSFVSYLS